jgi:hypothetical protein
MLPGMANFFGKKGLGSSILRGAQGLNPIDISRGDRSRAWQYIMNTDGRSVNTVYDSARKTHRGTSPRWSGMDKLRQGVRGYFAGDNLNDMARNMGMEIGATPAEMRRRNKLVRRTVAGVAGAYVAGNTLFGQNNGLSSAAGAGMQVGAHGAIMGLIGSRNPAAGVAYGTWAGLNAMRPGNNLGPF